jgi:hypothetical protein
VDDSHSLYSAVSLETELPVRAMNLMKDEECCQFGRDAVKPGIIQ